jgi:transcriptional regulator
VPNPTPRKVRVLELRSDGLSVDAIARKLGCTRRRVFQVLADARAGGRINADRAPGS